MTTSQRPLVFILASAFLVGSASLSHPSAQRSAYSPDLRQEAPIPSPTLGDVSSVGLSVYSAGARMPACASAVRDQSTGGCLQAASTPQLGKLYPIGPSLFVSPAGRVGLGTTTPTAKLDVNGGMDLSGTLSKNGVSFMHTSGGSGTTALGAEALASVTTGSGNTAVGSSALRSNTSGAFNTALGFQALRSNTTGNYNSASGYMALRANVGGVRNTATGSYALYSNTEGDSNTAIGMGALPFNGNGNRNTAVGDSALFYNTLGSSNTAIGVSAMALNTTGNLNTAVGNRALSKNTFGGANVAVGYSAMRNNGSGFNNTVVGYAALFNNSTGQDNIAIGYYAGLYTTGSGNIHIGNQGAAESSTTRIGTYQSRAFVAGIRGVTTGVADAIPVMIDSVGQLGTISSSCRFKEDIRDMGDATERLMDLRAVLFRYKERNEDGDGPIEFGLIAEEVAEVFPELVVYDDEGRPETIKYHLLGTMLLNELQKEHQRNDAQQAEIAALSQRLALVEQRE
jgi:hypothetical protein